VGESIGPTNFSGIDSTSILEMNSKLTEHYIINL